jgi:small subunit ribosomal protein S20
LANIKSAIKRARQEKKRHAANRAIKARMRTSVRGANNMIASQELGEAQEAVKAAISEIDKAAQKGIIHANQAARRKSRLMKRLNRAQG